MPVYEADEVDGRLFIAMRLVDGVDLATMIRERERLEPSLAGRLVAQVAGALDAAHERGLVHRDVKPRNIAAAADAVWVTLGPSVDVRYANTVVRVDPRRREVVGEPIPVLRGPIQPTLVGDELWLLSPAEGALGRVDTGRGRMVGTPVRVGQEPSALSYGAGALWVADRRRDVVTRVDP